jgi:hypothetical protein
VARRGSPSGLAVGFALGAGLGLGVGLLVLSDGHDRGAFLSARLAVGCTVLALDRNNGRTKAEPCRDLALQLTAALRAPRLVPAAH